MFARMPSLSPDRKRRRQAITLARSEDNSRWSWYAAACLLRLVCIFLPGYIHPDEFLQSAEVAASDVFKLGKQPPSFTRQIPTPISLPMQPGLAYSPFSFRFHSPSTLH